MAGIRRKARMTALKTLFELDIAGHDPETTLERLVGEETLAQSGAQFAQELVKGVLENKQTIDATIKKYAPAWPLEQMAITDRNILRLAIFEILLNNKVPVKAAINEAVELAKTFGSESSPRFINGVLSSVYAEINSKKKGG